MLTGAPSIVVHICNDVDRLQEVYHRHEQEEGRQTQSVAKVKVKQQSDKIEDNQQAKENRLGRPDVEHGGGSDLPQEQA